MAGGKGTRIASMHWDVPKPLINIMGKPVLQYEIENLVRQGLTEIVLTVSHKAEMIQEYFGNGERFGCQIRYFVERTPLGNAGALIKMQEELVEDFLLLNADSVFDIDFQRFIGFHKKNKALATLFTHPNSHPYDSSLVIEDDRHRVLSWLNKEDGRPDYYKNMTNAGLHILSPEILSLAAKNGIIPDSVGVTHKIDLDRDILKPAVFTSRIYAYSSPEYVKDMGTPERYAAVVKDYKTGIIKRKNLQNKQKAVFLDRDGTINQYKGFLRDIDDFWLIKGVCEAIRKINASGYLAIVVTNQPVIARGELTYEGLTKIHNKMETLLGQEGAYIDAIYFCPHHPDGGFEGEILELKRQCSCRKPEPGMLLQAAIDFNIDLSKSWMVGDSRNDIDAGKSAGCETVLIGNGDYGQEMTVGSLLEFVNSVVMSRS